MLSINVKNFYFMQHKKNKLQKNLRWSLVEFLFDEMLTNHFENQAQYIERH